MSHVREGGKPVAASPGRATTPAICRTPHRSAQRRTAPQALRPNHSPAPVDPGTHRCRRPLRRRGMAYRDNVVIAGNSSCRLTWDTRELGVAGRAVAVAAGPRLTAMQSLFIGGTPQPRGISRPRELMAPSAPEADTDFGLV